MRYPYDTRIGARSVETYRDRLVIKGVPTVVMVPTTVIVDITIPRDVVRVVKHDGGYPEEQYRTPAYVDAETRELVVLDTDDCAYSATGLPQGHDITDLLESNEDAKGDLYDAVEEVTSTLIKDRGVAK